VPYPVELFWREQGPGGRVTSVYDPALAKPPFGPAVLRESDQPEPRRLWPISGVGVQYRDEGSGRLVSKIIVLAVRLGPDDFWTTTVLVIDNVEKDINDWTFRTKVRTQHMAPKHSKTQVSRHRSARPLAMSVAGRRCRTPLSATTPARCMPTSCRPARPT
jgi:hypothetical protein